MSLQIRLVLLLAFCTTVGSNAYCQKLNGEIFIPIDNRQEVWIRPKIDTLINHKDYELKIRVSPEYKVSQFLFEKGLAVQNDSVLVITANSLKNGGCDTAVLRVIVTSIRGSRIMLFQKRFLIQVPEKTYPVNNGAKTNLIMVNDKTVLERNSPYAKNLFTDPHTHFTMYDNEKSMKKLDVKSVTMALMEKEGKQYATPGDTLSPDAVRELKKIRNPTPVYFRVESQNGKVKRTVWNRVIIYPE